MNRKGKFLLTISLLFGLIACTSTNPPAENGVKTAGTLNVSTLTSTGNGDFSPKHIVAIWIENSSGKFVKTLLVNAQVRRNYLKKWLNSNSSANTTDAISGATLSSYGTLTCSWNGTNTSGAVVSDGTYKVCMELSESDTSSNSSTFTFTKGTAVDSQTPANQPCFSSVSLQWTPQ